MKVYAKENFKETRFKKGFDTVSLSEAVGISQQGMSQIENRVNGASPMTAKLITEVLKVGFDEVFELVDRK